MQEQKSPPTTKKILRTQKRVMGWTLFLSNLFALVLILGAGLLWQMQAYAGGWEALRRTAFTAVCVQVPSWQDPLQVQLYLAADGLAPATVDITAFAVLLCIGLLSFWLLQSIVRNISESAWTRRVHQYMRRLTDLAEEARRLSAAKVRQEAQKPRVDDLQDAISHIRPTEPDRLHTGDPDLKGLEDAVNDLLDRMQAAYSQQSRFVSDASHELRTPIAVLKGYADLLERWGKDDPQVRDEAIAAIQAEAERMNRLVEQLLFLARGDSGRLQVKQEPLDLQDLMQETWEESRMIDGKHRWLLDAPAPMPYLGDRDMLKQAVRILSDNAAKYTPEGKEITLRANLDSQGRPCLSVRDEGMGIKREDVPHVFDRFFRSDPARSRQSGGAGLGLSIADWIVTRHGGYLEVYSWEGVGSRFTIVLPVAEQSVSSCPEKRVEDTL